MINLNEGDNVLFQAQPAGIGLQRKAAPEDVREKFQAQPAGIELQLYPTGGRLANRFFEVFLTSSRQKGEIRGFFEVVGNRGVLMAEGLLSSGRSRLQWRAVLSAVAIRPDRH